MNLLQKAVHFLGKIAFYPLPLRVRALQYALKPMKFIAFERRLRFGALDRPHYGYCIYHAGVLAKKLGYDRISVIEFGVAGGRGLTLIEQYVCEIRRSLAIDFEVYGFDTGAGLPKPKDYRDLPYVWQTDQFPMDVDRLRESPTYHD